MRRLSFWILIAPLLIAGSAWADDGWQKAFNFPLTSNASDAGRAATFTDPADGFTYAYFGAATANGAQVWRSSDGVSWNQVNVNGFGTQAGLPLASDVSWVSSYTVSGIPYVYVGVTPNNSLNDGVQIYRSAGGSSTSQWSLVLSSVTLTSAVAVTPGGGPGTPFNSAFYFGTVNTVGGARVWKSTSADGLDSWMVLGPGGFGEGAAANSNLSYLKVFGSELYAATGCSASGPACGQIWKSTGTVNPTDVDTWTQVLAATDTFDAATHSITALESFNGYLYAATLNTAGHAQVIRSATPDTGGWAAVTTSDFGCTNCFSFLETTAIQSLRAVDGYLYASTWNSSTGLIVYRSTDGATGTWVRSNATTGFGTVNNQYLGDFVLLGTTVLGNTFNSSGGALWKALLPNAAAQPGAPSAAFVSQTSITWTWALAAGATGYAVFDSSSPATQIGNPVAPPFAEIDLSTNTQYGIIVAGLSSVGTGTFSAAGQIYTLAAPPTSFALVQVFSSSITLSWAANTNPSGTSYQIQYWETGGATTTVTTAALAATLNGLLDGSTYFLTVNALNGNGLAAPSGIVLSTLTIVVPSLTTSVGPAGATILFNTPSGEAELLIPAGAFNETVSVTLSTASLFPTAPSNAAQLTPTGVGLEVAVNPSIEPLKTVLITVPYTTSEMLGFDLNELAVSRYDSTQNVWVPLASSLEASSGQISAATDHLSPFQIMQSAPTTSVSAAKAFPNPLRPALGETYMTFSLLPAGARVRIYTLTGVLIKDLTADGAGTVDWDGTNEGGASVASGVYFVYAQGNGTKQSFKVAVQR